MFNDEGAHYTVLTNYGMAADGVFGTYEQAFQWAVTILKGTNRVQIDNKDDEQLYLDNSDFCRIVPLSI